MELIPILSTIILVATISTFLLAIGAYILYKIRESKGQTAVGPQPREVQAELVTPAEAPSQQRTPKPGRVIPQREYEEPRPATAVSKQTVILKQAAAAPSQPGFTPQPRPYQAYTRQTVSSAGQHEAKVPVGKNEEKEKKQADSRFLKYTAEGYIPAKEDKEAGALKWR